MVSFAHPGQLPIAAEVCQSFVLDNGAFSEWRATGEPVDYEGYLAWVREWMLHPGFDWCIIPDKIDGTDAENDAMIEAWPLGQSRGVPVYHLHENPERFGRLCREWPRVAIGSSGWWKTPGTEDWWKRLGEVLPRGCDESGRPLAKLHGLRMLNPTVFSHLPLSSADSCGVARNLGMDGRWDTGYLGGLSKDMRAEILASRYEQHAAASTWEPRGQNMSFGLLG